MGLAVLQSREYQSIVPALPPQHLAEASEQVCSTENLNSFVYLSIFLIMASLGVSRENGGKFHMFGPRMTKTPAVLYMCTSSNI